MERSRKECISPGGEFYTCTGKVLGRIIQSFTPSQSVIGRPRGGGGALQGSIFLPVLFLFPIPTALLQQPLNLKQVAISQLPPLYYTSDFQGDPPNSSCEDSEGSLISVPSTLSHFLPNTVTDVMILMTARAHLASR